MLVSGDDQPVEKALVGVDIVGTGLGAVARILWGTLEELAAAGLGLTLRPGVYQPAAANRLAKYVVKVVAFQQAVYVATVGLARIGGGAAIPGSPVGLGQMARLVPFVHVWLDVFQLKARIERGR